MKATGGCADCAVPAGVTALACAVAEQVPSIDDLALLAAVFTQLGDTLALIAVQRTRRAGACGD